ncbi:SusC/RagA family TonB-linked outer membrane protein [Tellurirhabdus rosea]|uniref:SusC/RagA family TonB-linked outer membrane protein n=1 Tax=Tellurirhabdus rosea TaxID=2674997 RepID=UPI0022503C69|nr:SusC/RagA family TonB-linked outer membrane protein [Tellurirhabdus rosea]
MRKLLPLLLLFGLLTGAGTARAQDRTVTGKVTGSEDGAPIPGVNVSLKGSTRGTSTDTEGNYRLAVPDGQSLVFSFVGMLPQEVAVGNRTVVNVALVPDLKMLSEVVVTAVGIERQNRSLGYSVERLSADRLVQKSEPDVLRAMQGKIPGVNINGSGGTAGSSARITIRGANSFLGTNQPLFVVDGIPYDNSLNENASFRDNGAAVSSRIADLDPNNIASMTVLKGAAAAALYGTRAANGVIVITTKSGTNRPSKKGLEVTFNTSFSAENIASYPDFQNTYGSGSQGVYANANGTWGPAFGLGRTYAANGNWVANTSGVDSIPVWVGYNTFAANYPALAAQYGLRANGNVPYRAYPDNVRNFFRQGSLFENSISVSGGGPKASVTAVVSRTDQKSYFPGSGFERTNVSVGGNTNLDNGLTVGANLAYTNTIQNSPLFGADGTSPLARMFQQPRNWPLDQLPYQDPFGNGVFFFPFGQADNPYWSVNNSIYTSKVNRIVVNGTLSYDLTKWLNVTYKGGYNAYNDNSFQRISAGSLSGAQGIGNMQFDAVSFGEQDHNLLLNFDRNLTPDISFRAILGGNYNQRLNDQTSVNGLGIVVRGIDLITNVNTVTPNTGNTYTQQRRLYAGFTDMTFGYKDFFFLNLTGRNDWSSTLPRNNRSYFYYSASGSLVFTDAFKLTSNILSSGKLRLGYAKVGRDAAPYQTVNTYRVNLGESSNQQGSTRYNDYPFNGQAGASVAAVAFDPNLKPEFTTEIETGVNLEFFRGRASLDFTYYNRLSTDIIARRALPQSTGYSFLLTNFGAIRNSGVEIGLSVTPVQLSSGFKWDIFAAYTQNRNIVESLADGVQEVILRNIFTNQPVPVVRPGEWFGVLRGTKVARDENGNVLINPLTGLTIPDVNQGIIANPNPKFTLGLTNTFSYKGLSLSAVIDYRHGGDLYSWTNQFLLGRGVTKDTENREIPRVLAGVLGDANTLKPLLDGEGKPIPNTIQVLENNVYFQAAGGSLAINAPNEFSVWDATVIRLREISLGYTLPKAWLTKLPFGSVNLSLTGRNLWFNAPNFPKAANFDPEVNTFGNTNTQGIDFFTAPSVRRLGVNLRMTF